MAPGRSPGSGPSLAASRHTNQPGLLKYRTASRSVEVDVLDQLDAPAVRRWSIAAADALAEHQAEIDQLNVFPVPDGDTGTNLALTVGAASDALAADTASTAATALRSLARGAVI